MDQTGVAGVSVEWGSNVSLNRQPQKQDIDSDATTVVVGSQGRKGLGLLSSAYQGLER